MYVCLLCQYTQINAFLVCTLFVCEYECASSLRSSLRLSTDFKQHFNFFSAVSFPLIFVVVVVVVFIFAIYLEKRLVGRHLIKQ